MADILVAEDYKSTRSALRMLLTTAGHTVRLAENGEQALALWREKRPDLLLLDVMMPKKSGYQVIAEIRRTDAALPVIFLTARAEKPDVLLGLELGSDDYIAKPFDGDELLARVAAVLRRAGAAPAGPAAPPADGTPEPAAGETFTFAGRVVGVESLQLADASGARVELGINEHKLIRLFARRAGEVVRRDDIILELWGRDYAGADHSVDQLMSRLRKILGPAASCIRTVYGCGYRYLPPS